MEKLLTLWDKDNSGELKFLLSEVHTWVENNSIQFDDKDVWRYLNSTDIFPMKIYIDDIEFEVSSLLIDIFESEFNTNFHKNLYSIDLCNI